MRRDIQVNTQIGDMVLTDSNSVSTYPFEWLYERDSNIYGCVTLPAYFERSNLEYGVKINIPYIPMYKTIKLKFVQDYGDGNTRTFINTSDNSEYFDVHSKLYNLDERALKASELILIDEENYILQLVGNKLLLWSSKTSDAKNINANIQNRNLLLKCLPSNSYRYPVSGVGLIRYLHANISNTDLADVLQSEFEAENVKVLNASFDSDTGNLDLDLDFSKVDADV